MITYVGNYSIIVSRATGKLGLLKKKKENKAAPQQQLNSLTERACISPYSALLDYCYKKQHIRR